MNILRVWYGMMTKSHLVSYKGDLLSYVIISIDAPDVSIGFSYGYAECRKVVYTEG